MVELWYENWWHRKKSETKKWKTWYNCFDATRTKVIAMLTQTIATFSHLMEPFLSYFIGHNKFNSSLLATMFWILRTILTEFSWIKFSLLILAIDLLSFHIFMLGRKIIRSIQHLWFLKQKICQLHDQPLWTVSDLDSDQSRQNRGKTGTINRMKSPNIRFWLDETKKHGRNSTYMNGVLNRNICNCWVLDDLEVIAILLL